MRRVVEGSRNLLDTRKRLAVCHAVDNRRSSTSRSEGWGFPARDEPACELGLSEAVSRLQQARSEHGQETLLRASSAGRLDVVILAQSSGYWPSMAEIIQADLNAVGFNARSTPWTPPSSTAPATRASRTSFLGEGSPDTFQPYGLYVTFFGRTTRGRAAGAAGGTRRSTKP